MEATVFCQRCGAELPAGSLKFLVTIHVTADFDGVLPSEVTNAEDLESFMRQVDAEDPVTVGNDVYQSQGFLLCPACKSSFLENPLALPPEEGHDEGGRVH